MERSMGPYFDLDFDKKDDLLSGLGELCGGFS